MTSSTSPNLRAAREAPATPPNVRKIDMNRLLMAPKVEYVARRRIHFDFDVVLVDDRRDEVPSIMDTPKKVPKVYDTPAAPFVPMRGDTWAPKRPHASRRLGLANLANNATTASTPTRPVRAISRQEALQRAPKPNRRAAPRFERVVNNRHRLWLEREQNRALLRRLRRAFRILNTKKNVRWIVNFCNRHMTTTTPAAFYEEISRVFASL